MWSSDTRRDTEPFSFTVQEKDSRREQVASLRTETAMSGKRAAILAASGWGPKESNYCDLLQFCFLFFFESCAFV